MIKRILLILILLPSIVSAAVIHGNVYDLSLELQKNVVVEVNSAPKQTMVAKEGSYSFELPEGQYIITAKKIEDSMILASAEEEINLKADGNYIVDLIVFENFEEDETLLEESDIEVDTSALEDEHLPVWSYIAAAIIIILIILFFIIKNKKKPKQEDPYLEKVIKIIKREGGRTTQKEIRKDLGLSEAKVSLMVTQLEHEGKLKKIKKGRGNIIVLT